jgi:hypothetical protein
MLFEKMMYKYVLDKKKGDKLKIIKNLDKIEDQQLKPCRQYEKT